MAKITDFKISKSAARALMKDPSVRADLIGRAKRIRAAAEGMSVSGNAKYGIAAWDGKVSAHVTVYTISNAAKRANAQGKPSKPLERAIDAGRG